MKKLLTFVVLNVLAFTLVAQEPTQIPPGGSWTTARSIINTNMVQVYDSLGSLRLASTLNFGFIESLRDSITDHLLRIMALESSGVGSGGSMTWPTTAGLAKYSGSGSWATSVTDNSVNWDSAYAARNRWDGSSTGLNAATGRTSLGATTIGANLFRLTNPSAVTYPQFNADNTVTALPLSFYKIALGINNVTNESKATMFANSVLTGTTTFGVIQPSIAGGTIGSTTYSIGHIYGSGDLTLHIGSGTNNVYFAGSFMIFQGISINLGTNSILMTGSIGNTNSRVLKGWFTDLQVTNPIVGSVTGSAGTVTGFNPNGGSFTFNGAHSFTATLLDNTSLVFPTSGTVATTDNVQDIIDTNHAAWLAEAPEGLVMSDTTDLLTTNKRLTDSLSALRQLVYTLVGQLNLDIVAPAFLSAEIGTYNDSIIAVRFNATDINHDSVPPPSAFTVLENGVLFGITATELSNDSLYVALDSLAAASSTITIAYTKGVPAIQDTSGNQTASWTAQAVTNNVTGSGGGGGEMINNGTFDSSTYWTIGGGTTISGGSATLLASGAYVTQTNANMASPIQNSTTYTLSIYVSTTCYLYIYDASSSYDYMDGYVTLTGAGVHTLEFTTPADIESVGAGIQIRNVGDSVTIDDVSLTVSV